MRVVIVSISDNDKHFCIPIQEYCKRLGSSVHIVNLPPVTGENIALVIKKETEKLFSFLQQKYSTAYRILLSKEGEQLSTFDIAKIVNENTQGVVFCIGGPYGLDEAVLGKIIHKKISFGLITMPHGLVKLVLLEQLYRISMINQGKRYHY